MRHRMNVHESSEDIIQVSFDSAEGHVKDLGRSADE